MEKQNEKKTDTIRIQYKGTFEAWLNESDEETAKEKINTIGNFLTNLGIDSYCVSIYKEDKKICNACHKILNETTIIDMNFKIRSEKKDDKE